MLDCLSLWKMVSDGGIDRQATAFFSFMMDFPGPARSTRHLSFHRSEGGSRAKTSYPHAVTVVNVVTVCLADKLAGVHVVGNNGRSPVCRSNNSGVIQ